MMESTSVSSDDDEASLEERGGIKKRQVEVQKIAKAFPEKINPTKQISTKYNPMSVLKLPFSFFFIAGGGGGDDDGTMGGLLLGFNSFKSTEPDCLLSDPVLELETIEEIEEELDEKCIDEPDDVDVVENRDERLETLFSADESNLYDEDDDDNMDFDFFSHDVSNIF